MKKLAIKSLAASIALLPSGAGAQQADIQIQTHQVGNAGHSWRSGHRMRQPGHRGPRFPHIRRIQRGFAVPHFWFGPQFHVRNWGRYGFSQPAQDRRWVRYYDDALLIDRRGMVHDGRYGLDWDRYGERWGYEDGIPEYVGDGDFNPDEEDYAWAEQFEGEDHAEGGMAYGHGGYAQPGYGAGGYGGYGYGYGGGVITVTTTTTTTEGVATTRYVDEEVEHRPAGRRVRHVRRAAHPAPSCDCPAQAAPHRPHPRPAPQPAPARPPRITGERG